MILMMMMMIVGVVGLVVEAAVLTVEHTDVAEPPLAGSAAPVTALIVRTGLGLVTGAGDRVLVLAAAGHLLRHRHHLAVGLAAVQVRAVEGDEHPVGHVYPTLLGRILGRGVAAALVHAGILLQEDDVALVAPGVGLTHGLGGVGGLAAADREDDHDGDAEDDEEAADDGPGHHVLLV